jgi:hypothetical protein
MLQIDDSKNNEEIKMEDLNPGELAIILNNEGFPDYTGNIIYTYKDVRRLCNVAISLTSEHYWESTFGVDLKVQSFKPGTILRFKVI